MKQYQLEHKGKVVLSKDTEAELMKEATAVVTLGETYDVFEVERKSLGSISLSLTKSDVVAPPKTNTVPTKRKRRTPEELEAAGIKSRSKTEPNEEEVKADTKKTEVADKPVKKKEEVKTPADILTGDATPEDFEESKLTDVKATATTEEDDDDIDEAFNDAPDINDQDDFSTDDALAPELDSEDTKEEFFS